MINESVAWLMEHVEEEFGRFDPQTGRFMQGNGWAVTNQDVMLLLAYLFLSDHPMNRYCGQERLLRTIEQAGDALRSFQYPDGKVELVKEDGSKWGAIYMPWSMYHWLETYHRLNHVIEDSRRERWEEGLQLAYSGIEQEMRDSLDRFEQPTDTGLPSLESVVHNIPVWNAMALNRASQLFGRADWRETAERMICLAMQAQHPDGYWREHQGPTTLYNLVYTHALGLYHYHGGAIDVIPALRRALRFHEVFTYPDGSRVETIDGRAKYHPHPSPLGLIGFSMFAEGRSLTEQYIRLAIRQGRKWRTAHYAELLRYWEHYTELPPEPSLFERESFQCEHAHALVIKEQGWYCCISGYTSPAVESRWGQDRQSFVGVWNAQTGLIIGGGNSKNQPAWSTFELHSEGGEHFYVPHQGEVNLLQREATLHYGEHGCRIRIVSLNQKQLVLQFQAAPGLEGEARVNIPLKLLTDRELRTSDANIDKLEAANTSLSFKDGKHWLSHSQWKLELDGPFEFIWPSYPFNPYEKEGKADLSEAVGLITFPLWQMLSKKVTLTIL